MKKILSLMAATMLLSMIALPTFAASAEDTESPSDVEDLTATACNGAAKLTWSAATDDVGVTGYIVHYGTKSVQVKGDTYDKNIDAGNVRETVVPTLTNGTTYYFSVVAYDAAKNESVAWAPEAHVAPSAEAGSCEDNEAPKVADAEALNIEEVKVVFSEAVALPEEDAHLAFTIDNDETFETLEVSKAEVDEEDETGKTVILSTDDQSDGVEYTLTVGIDIKDKAGNPIISGTSDTAIFTGSVAPKAEEDVSGPQIEGVETVDSTHILINFNETVVLGIDPSENFVITAKDDETDVLEILGVSLGPNTENVDDASAVVTTSEQKAVEYIVSVVGLEDESGNLIGEGASGTFDGVVGGGEPGEERDVTPPADVANFLAEKIVEAGKQSVTLSWDVPAESDAVEQKIYKSTDKGEKYASEATLDGDATEYEVGELDPGEYWFKITEEDAAGNESEGKITKIILSETGPEMIGLVLLSIGLGRIVAKRKKQ